jgi:hypothetical protein
MSTATAISQSVKMPLQISKEINIKDGGGTMSLVRSQKQLLNLHNALIKEAKMQGLSKYQVSLLPLVFGELASCRRFGRSSVQVGLSNTIDSSAI